MDINWSLVLEWILEVAWVAAVFVAGLYISKMLSNMVRRSLERQKVDVTLVRFGSNVVRWAILAVVGIACLGAFGIETTSFAAIIGAAGLAIGLAFQGTLSAIAAGAMLLILRPFKVGDVIGINGQTGIVEEIGLFTTTIYAFANHKLILSNKDVFGSAIENKTFDDMVRVDVDVGTDYSEDLDNVRAVLMAALEALEGGERPQVYLKALGGSSIDWSVRKWTTAQNYLALRDAITLATKKALDAADIGIPFPQMDVHIDGGLDKAA